MNAIEIYAICLGGILSLLFMKKNILPPTTRLIRWASIYVAKYSSYQYVLSDRAWLGPWTVSAMSFQTIYIASNIVCLCYDIPSLSEASLRAGQLSLINMLPTYCSFHLGFLADRLGVSHDRWRTIHRLSAILTFCLSAFHALVIVFTTATFSLQNIRNLYTLIGATLIASTTLLAIPVFRKPSYELFLKSHKILAIVSAIGAWQHVLSSQKSTIFIYFYIFCGSAFFLNTLHLLLSLFRNFKWGKKLPRAVIRQGDGALRITVKLPRPLKIDAGQYIELWLGFASFSSMLQTHPFVVTSWTELEQDSLDLLVQPRRGLTNTLLRNCVSRGLESSHHIALIGGPYGLSLPVWDFETVFMVATGFGITTMIPYLKKLLHGYNLCKARTRRIHLVWQVLHPGLVSAAEDLLNDALRSDTTRDGYILCISIYENDRRLEESFGEHGRVTCYPGEPNLPEIFRKEMDGSFLMSEINKILYGSVNQEFFEKLQRFEQANGRVLALISGTAKARYQLRKLVRIYLSRKVQLSELEYQPD